VGRNVAGAAWIGVLAPGSAELGGLVHDDEVFVTVLLELDGHPDTREAGTDDEDATVMNASTERCGGSRLGRR
jgi:hypothetical protein